MLEWQGNSIWSESEYWQDIYSLSYSYASNGLGEQEIVGWIEYVWNEHGQEMLFEQWYKGDPEPTGYPLIHGKEPASTTKITYSQKGNNTSGILSNKPMVNNSLMVYTYTELERKQASITGYQWNGTEWESILVRTYYYSKIINSNSNPSFSVSLDSYPNPAKSSLNIVGTSRTKDSTPRSEGKTTGQLCSR